MKCMDKLNNYGWCQLINRGRTMHRKIIITLLAVVLSLSLISCTANEDADNDIDKLFNGILAADEVYLRTGGGAPLGISYVGLSSEQTQTAVELLSSVDTSSLAEAEINAPYYVSVELIFEDSNGWQSIEIIKTVSMSTPTVSIFTPTLYISFKQIDHLIDFELKTDEDWAEYLELNQNQKILTYEYTGSFDFEELSNLVQTILPDTEDVENCAFIQKTAGTGEAFYQNKGSTAELQNVLEGTIRTTYEYTNGDDYSFDVKITIGENVYLVDTKTGVFSKNGGALYQYDEKWIQRMQLFTGTRPDPS